MVVKVYISGISGNKEVKKRQQRVLMILDSKNIKYDVIDITEPGKETDKDFMQNNATSNGGTVSDPNPRSPLPPQLFNDDEYCGDYDQFDMANEVDTLEQFLKLEVPPEETVAAENDKENTLNGDVAKDSKENSQEKEIPQTEDTENEKSTAKEGSASREATPVKVEEVAKEKSPEKESSPERQQSVEKEKTPEKEPQVAEEKHISKENTPEVESVNENGTVSSRDQSQEKETKTVESKKDPSELLIESEKSAE